MAKSKITIPQVNGLSLGGDIGHLGKGHHELELTAAQIKDLKAAGVKVESTAAIKG